MFWPDVLLRILTVIMASLIVLAAILSFQTSSEYKTLLSNYDAEIATLDHGRNSSWPDGQTVRVKSDGVIHICKHVHLDHLRLLNPIICEDGAVITVK